MRPAENPWWTQGDVTERSPGFVRDQPHYSQPLRLNHTNGMIAVISMSASAYG